MRSCGNNGDLRDREWMDDESYSTQRSFYQKVLHIRCKVLYQIKAKYCIYWLILIHEIKTELNVKSNSFLK